MKQLPMHIAMQIAVLIKEEETNKLTQRYSTTTTICIPVQGTYKIFILKKTKKRMSFIVISIVRDSFINTLYFEFIKVLRSVFSQQENS